MAIKFVSAVCKTCVTVVLLYVQGVLTWRQQFKIVICSKEPGTRTRFQNPLQASKSG